MKPEIFSFIALLFRSSLSLFAQLTDEKLVPILTVPRFYAILKTSQPLTIDGKNDEAAWSKAVLSEQLTTNI